MYMIPIVRICIALGITCEPILVACQCSYEKKATYIVNDVIIMVYNNTRLCNDEV